MTLLLLPLCACLLARARALVGVLAHSQHGVPNGTMGGQDRHSIFSDPLFANASAFNFTLLPQSPALLALGFQQIDLSTVGPRPP